VLYLCDDCSQRLGPRHAQVFARHFLAVLAALLSRLQATGAPLPPTGRAGEP
jgi:hypothetical protein